MRARAEPHHPRWVLNLAGSTLWLHIFAFGPLEWLWRSLTYWKRQHILLSEAPSRN